MLLVMNLPVTRSPTKPGRFDGIVVGLAMVYPTVLTLAYFVLLADHARGWQQGVYGVGKGVQFLLPVAWVVLVERSRLDWARPKGSGVFGGLAFGGAVALGLFLLHEAVLHPTGLAANLGDQVARKVMGFVGDTGAAYLALSAFYCFAHSLLEEYYWRWFVFGRLRRWCRVSHAAVISSVGFMAHHVVILALFLGWDSPLTYLGSLGVGVGGLYWAWLYCRTGSLYASWLSHLVVDAGIFAIGWQILQRAA